MISQYKKDLFCLFLGLVSVLLFFFPISFLGKTLCFADLGSLHLPHRYFILDAFQSGTIPLWSHLIQGGFPLHAESEMGIVYPLYMLLSLLNINPPIIINISVIFHTFLSFTGMYFCGRQLRFTTLASLFIGIGFALSGISTVHIMQLNMKIGMAVTPWLAVALIMITRNVLSKSGNIILGLFFGLQFLGSHPQYTFYNTFFIFLYVGCYVVYMFISGRFRAGMSFLFNVIFALFWGGLLGGIQWLPTLELIPISLREGSVSQSMGALNWKGFLIFLIPTIWGGTLGVTDLRALYFLDFFHEHAQYIGLLPLLLVVIIVLFRSEQRHDFYFKFILLFLLIISLDMGFGNKAAFSFLYARLPLINSFTCPMRVLLISGFFLLLLSGLGFTRLEQRKLSISRKGWLFVGSLLTLAMCCYIFLVRSSVVDVFQQGKMKKIVFSLSLILIFSILLFIILYSKKRILFYLLPLLLFGDLIFFFGDYNPVMSMSEYNKPNRIADMIKKRSKGERIFSFIQLTKSGVPPGLLPLDTHVRYGVASMSTTFSLSLQQQHNKFRALHSCYRKTPEKIIIDSIEPFRELGIRFLLSIKPLSCDEIHYIDRVDNVLLYELNTPVSLIELNVSGTNYAVKDWSIERSRFNEANVSCSLMKPIPEKVFHLIIKDTYYPGWQVLEVNNKVPIHDIDGWKMVLVNNEGKSDIKLTLQYRPMSYKIGMFFSFIGILIMSMITSIAMLCRSPANQPI